MAKNRESAYAALAQNRQEEQAQTVNIIKGDTVPTPVAPREAAVEPTPEPVSDIKTYGRPKVYNSENPRSTITLVLTAERKRKLKVYAANHDCTISELISAYIDQL